jgi:ABC-type sugar transport system ATPase subunit
MPREVDINDVSLRAAEVWGVDAQINQAQEELAEAVVALNHYRRGRASLAEVAEEMADVRLCFEELFAVLPALRILEPDVFQNKLLRLEYRVCKAENDAGIGPKEDMA